MRFSPATLTRVLDLAKRYPQPSRLDHGALATAEQERCPLVTGDRNLRTAAESEGVEVHGTLWIAERLVEAGLLSVAELRNAYGRMKSAGRRLPWAEVERQLVRLAASVS